MQLRTALGTAFGSVTNEDQLSVVDHLDELRTRLIVALAVIGVAFGLCFWQNHELISLINAPLKHQTQQQARSGQGVLGASYRVQIQARNVARETESLTKVLAQHQSPAVKSQLAGIQRGLASSAKKLSAPPSGNNPVTLGIGESLTTTAGVSLLFALILSLPIILMQVYGFFMPALSGQQRRRVRPVLMAAPALFIVGVLFGYEVVLPAAVHFLQNFNSSQFDVLVQASQYYHFAATTLLAMGLIFEVPLLVVGLTQAGVVTPAQLRKGRKFALLACVAVAAFLPGDAFTMLLESAPLYVLYEAGILIASLLDRRNATVEA
jgi:sec-independent protein translocase protein TatC